MFQRTVPQLAVGVGGPVVGTIVSLMPHIETALRITSLLVGITAGLVTIYFAVKRGAR